MRSVQRKCNETVSHDVDEKSLILETITLAGLRTLGFRF